MKTQQAPKRPQETPWERLDRAFRTVLTVPKDKLLKEEARLRRTKVRKKAPKKRG